MAAAADGGTRNLRSVLGSADAEHFVGREAELDAVTELLDADTPSRILFVHGPGGIGKSALLRAAGRLAERAGFVCCFEPREPGNADLLADTNDPEREARLRKVLDVAFGTRPRSAGSGRSWRRSISGPASSEASLLAEFHVGRTTWYRLLRTARERVLAHR